MRGKSGLCDKVRFALTVLLAAVLCVSGVPAKAFAEALQEGTVRSDQAEGGNADREAVNDELAVPADDAAGLPVEGQGDELLVIEDLSESEDLALDLDGSSVDLAPEVADGEAADDSADQDVQLEEDLAVAARAAAAEVREEAGTDATAYQLIRAAYLRLAETELTPEAKTDEAAQPAGDTEEPTAQTLDAAALEVLCNHKGSATGVTRALWRVLEELGVDAREVEAADGRARAAGLSARTWLMVQVDDLWYHVDAASAAQELADAREKDPQAQPTLAGLLCSDADLRAGDEERFPWHLVSETGAVAEEVPEAPERYVFDDTPALDGTGADEPAPDDAATEASDSASAEAEDQSPTAEQPAAHDPSEPKPEDDEVNLTPQQTYHFTLELNNVWRSMPLTAGDNPDAWQFTLTQPGEVTLSVKASSVDMHFSVHAGDSISTTQYGSTFNLLAEWHGDVEETNSITLDLAKGTYYLIARDWDSVSVDTYYVRGSFRGTGGNIANAKVRAVAAQPYTGKRITPRPVVTYGGATLKLNQDYTLSYRNNVKIGKAQIVITGRGGFTGSKTVTFAIKKNIAKLKFSKVKKRVTYTGKAIKPKVTVKKGKTTLKRNKHYTLTYVKNRNAGVASIVITGKGAYAGRKIIKFRIVPRSLANAVVSGYKKKCVYTGKALKPKATVKAKIGKRRPTLKLGRDYTVTYKGNIVPGTGKIIIKGKGNFTGTKVVKFKVVRGSHYYLLKRDTWSFYNFSEAIPLSYYTRIFGSSKGRLLRSRDNGEGGTCYGFSATVGAIARYGVPRVTSYSKSGSKAYTIYQVGEYAYSSANGLTAHEFIQHGQVMQYDVRMQRELSNNRDNVNSLVSAARTSIKGGTPMVISFYWVDEDSGARCGHAVVPLRVKSNSSSRAVLTVYDCNTPGTPQTLTLYKHRGRLTSMSYSRDYGRFYGCSWSTPANEVRGLMQGHGVYRSGASVGSTLVAVSADARLVADGGESYTLSALAENDPNKVLHVMRTGGSPAAGELYWVNLGSNRMGFTDIAKDATVSVATEERGIDVDVSAGSEVVLDVTPSQTSTVAVDTGSSPDFQMTFTGADGTNAVQVTGAAEGIVVGKQEGDVITLSGASTITVSDAGRTTGEVALESDKVYQVDLSAASSSPDVNEDLSAQSADEVKLLVQMVGDLAGGTR